MLRSSDVCSTVEQVVAVRVRMFAASSARPRGYRPLVREVPLIGAYVLKDGRPDWRWTAIARWVMLDGYAQVPQ